MKILLTGSNGQLGRCFVEEARKFPILEIHPYSKADIDITQLNNFEQIKDLGEYDLCINCAAYTNVEKAEEDSETAFLVNKSGAKNIAQVCAEHNIFLIHFSTDYVYHNEKERPLLENDLLNPQSIYAQSKLAGEVLISRYIKRYIIFRTSWVYSAYGHNFLKTMFRLSESNKTLKVVDDQIGSPTSAHQIALEVLKFLNNSSQSNLDSTIGVYNLSNAGYTSWCGFARKIFALSSREILVEAIDSAAFPTKAKRPPYSVLDNSKLHSRLDIKLPDWEESLAICMKDYLS